MAGKTIVETFLTNAHVFSDNTIIKYKPLRGGGYEDFSWRNLEDQAVSFACGLMDRGLKPGEGVAILSFNRLEWIIADLGIMLAGGVVIPIYHTNTADQCAYILNDSCARFVIVEDRDQLAKIRSKTGELVNLSGTILIESHNVSGDDDAVSYAELLERGAARKSELGGELADRCAQICPQHMATIVYTSGTTGPPKGCMISHENIARVLDSIHQLIDLEPSENLSLMILPLSHLYPRVSGYYYNIFKNIPLAIAESLDTFAENLREVQPTYFTSVPRIFEKVHARITSTAEKGSAAKRRIFRWAVRVGRQRSRQITSHRPLSGWLRIRFRLADRLVFGKIREMLGGRLCFAVSAGAPLSEEVAEFVHCIGVQVLEFYGLTETISGTMTTFDNCRYGTVGKPMPGQEVRLADDGEILIRGNNFLGYYNRPDLTQQLMRDGWCHTGDIGRWDDGGFLIITDRKKDLIITSGGKNIAPQNIENLLKRIPLVSMAMVYGDGKNYLTALLTLDRPETETWALDQGITWTVYEELAVHPLVQGHIQWGMDHVNSKLASFETIKKFVVLPRDFTQEDGEITPTLKLKRKEIKAKYGSMLNALYQEGS